MAEERLVFQEELCSMEIINWLPPSPDLLAVDFYFRLWDYVKAKRYETCLASITDLNGDFANVLESFCEAECNKAEVAIVVLEVT
jgi:hypothetical protein